MSKDNQPTKDDESKINDRKSALNQLGSNFSRAPSLSFEQKLSTMGRRGFLKKLSALGISSEMIQYLSRSDIMKATKNPKDEVPFTAKIQFKDLSKLQNGHPGERLEMEPVIETMPREAWIRMEAAYNASNRLYKRLQSKFGDQSISVGVTTTKTGKYKLIVTRRLLHGVKDDTLPVSDEAIKENIPTNVDAEVGKNKYSTKITNIPVDFKRLRVRHYSYYDSVYNPKIPGGAQFDTQNPTKGFKTGTLAQPVWSKWKGRYEMLTAGHLATKEGWNQKYAYQPSYSPGDAYNFGTLTDYQNDASEKSNDIDGDGRDDKYTIADVDAAIYSLTEDSREHEYALANNDGTYGTKITGHWTWTKLKSEVDNSDWKLTKQGQTTGRTSGFIFYVDDNKKWFACHADGDHGDSGGPYYKKDATDTAVTAGVVSTGVDLNETGEYNGTGGNSLDHIMDTLNLRFN